MEKKKYSQPLFSQALTDFTIQMGLNDGKGIEVKDDLSRDPAGTSEDDNNSDFSGFTKFSNTNRPSGFFGKGKNSHSAQRPKKDFKEHGQAVDSEKVKVTGLFMGAQNKTTDRDHQKS